MSSDTSYALIGNDDNGDYVLFMGNGTELTANGLSISALEKGNVILEQKDGEWKLHNAVPVVISQGNNERRFDVGDFRAIDFR